MKNLLFGIIFAVVLGVSMPANAEFKDHPNHGQITAFVSAMVGTVDGLQNAYFVRYDRYFQGLPLLGDSLPDGTEELPAQYSRHPSDQFDTWQDLGPAIFKPGLDIPINMHTNTYISPDGPGYNIIFEFYYNGLGPDEYGNDGNHWMYVHMVGPNSGYGREDEWFIVPSGGE